ncbi:DUF6046 domain-containing protein [Niabella insulamsoli]|uniref:DUF6046 domain-containing protein n=1 Tax=Niabella insulamsoli TaxID=3144874 RepID=UPI0031FE413A
MSFILKLKDILTGRPYEVEGIEEANKKEVYASMMGVPMAMPLKIKRRTAPESDFWLLPWEPYITVDGRNIIVKRNVAKAKNTGSIKERWSQDDYAITIEGYFMNAESAIYPKADIERLKGICEAAEPVDVICDLFEALGITAMAIEDFSFPFTAGEANQDFTIKASSDKDWQLLIEENKNVS